VIRDEQLGSLASKQVQTTPYAMPVFKGRRNIFVATKNITNRRRQGIVQTVGGRAVQTAGAAGRRRLRRVGGFGYEDPEAEVYLGGGGVLSGGCGCGGCALRSDQTHYGGCSYGGCAYAGCAYCAQHHARHHVSRMGGLPVPVRSLAPVRSFWVRR
jgi:hypothetical protein